ncbi:hypothetical protein G6F57_017743 [Rhizopus arrhizus]|nr:hypothetical protein G6F57_017743 [Rhizopus arrhizus]
MTVRLAPPHSVTAYLLCPPPPRGSATHRPPLPKRAPGTVLAASSKAVMASLLPWAASGHPVRGTGRCARVRDRECARHGAGVAGDRASRLPARHRGH